MRLLHVTMVFYSLFTITAIHVLGQDEASINGSAGTVADSDASAGQQESPLAAQPAPKVNHCATCHTEPALWDESNQRLFISPEVLENDVHRQNGVSCAKCHGGNPTSMDFSKAHIRMEPVADLRSQCATCHRDQGLGLIKGVHAKAGDKDERGRGLPMDCGKCHGMNAHAILAASDPASPVYLDHQVQTCGSCHSRQLKTYEESVHGRGLNESGLLVTAVCANCHGAHGIYFAADRRSTLHVSNVATTCSQCHLFIKDRLAKSVHGQNEGLGAPTKEAAAGGTIKRHPTCTDCHQGHNLLNASTAKFRLDLSNRCGNCHADLWSRYSLSMHGELTHQGFAPAAECADCHGSHSILAVANPASQLAPGENRLHTCQKCHIYAVNKFTQYEPHANFKDAARYPQLHSIYSWVKLIVNFMFVCFLLHASLWFVRAFVDRFQHGGHAPYELDRYMLPRFGRFLRATYPVLIFVFVGLLATGLLLKYSDQPSLQRLANKMGGFQSVSDWHRFFAVVAIVVVVVHVFRVVRKVDQLRKKHTWKTVIFGPDSLIPNYRDLRELGGMLLWFIGFGRKPGFERWAYWEKLDYWAICVAAVLIGTSGLMLWYPNLFCLVFSGWVLNIANMVHSEFAIYVASFLFLIHFYHAHFRPEKFPMDLSVMTGMISEQHLRKYRPDYVARLESEGKLNEMREQALTYKKPWLKILGGVVVFTLGLGLLVVTVLASLAE